MRAWMLQHLDDETLRRGLFDSSSNERRSTASFIAHIAEFDRRCLYLPEGYPSMIAYCIAQLHLSEGAAFKRIWVARTARRFPGIMEAIGDGRLHLTAVVLLSRRLSQANYRELLAAAEHKTKAEIVQLLAERFPQPDLPFRLRALPRAAAQTVQLGLAEAATAHPTPAASEPTSNEQSPETVGSEHWPVPPEPARTRMTPLAPRAFGLQFTIDQETRDLLQEAQALLSHSVPNGDVPTVIKRALKELIAVLEKRKFAACITPRPATKRSGRARTIPAHVRRVVWQRDGGRCTFMSESGHRCEERRFLEFDHVRPVARKGLPTVEGMRLRCRAHNQYAAEQAFGSRFMQNKREQARSRAHSP